jgi:subtilase family serine protease
MGDEMRESNNALAVPVTITKSDLVPTAFTQPAPVVAGQSVSLSWSVANQGDGAATTFWYDRFVLSTDAVFDASDVVLDYFSAPTTLAPGASYSSTQSLTIPSFMAPGSYYLILRVDNFNNQSESDESNNALAVPVTIVVPTSTPTVTDTATATRTATRTVRLRGPRRLHRLVRPHLRHRDDAPAILHLCRMDSLSRLGAVLNG